MIAIIGILTALSLTGVIGQLVYEKGAPLHWQIAMFMVILFIFAVPVFA